jgi:hypothetical protein
MDCAREMELQVSPCFTLYFVPAQVGVAAGADAVAVLLVVVTGAPGVKV